MHSFRPIIRSPLQMLSIACSPYSFISSSQGFSTLLQSMPPAVRSSSVCFWVAPLSLGTIQMLSLVLLLVPVEWYDSTVRFSYTCPLKKCFLTSGIFLRWCRLKRDAEVIYRWESPTRNVFCYFEYFHIHTVLDHLGLTFAQRLWLHRMYLLLMKTFEYLLNLIGLSRVLSLGAWEYLTN